MAKALVITEKPSVARDIADALGGFREQDGYSERDDMIVTFAVGHLYELLAPEELDDKFKRWTLDVLPILPEEFGYKVKKGQTDRIRTIKQLIQRDDVDTIVNACDAGPRGRADLPRDRREPRRAAADPAPVAAVDDRGGDPHRLRAAPPRRGAAGSRRRRRVSRAVRTG
jgi:hypothetical protein